MKNDTAASLMARLVLVAGMLLLFVWDASAGTNTFKSEKEMAGTLEIGERASHLLTVGDRAKVALKNPEMVMPGDRLDIYQKTKTAMEDDKGNDLLALSGRLVVTDADKTKVVGVIEMANQEILTGSPVDYALPKEKQTSRYFGFLKSLADDIKDPEKETLKIAVVDVTDKKGDITRLSEAVFREVRDSICARPQFACVDRGDLKGLMKSYNLPTSRSVDRYIRRKIAADFAARYFINVSMAYGERKNKRGEMERDGTIKISLSAYDLTDKLTVKSAEYEARPDDYKQLGGEPDDVLYAGEYTRHGFLKIGLNRTAALKGRRVDNLFMVSLEDSVEKRFRKYVTDTSSDDIMFGNVEMELDGKQIHSSGEKNIYYSDIIKSGQHLLKVSMTPSLVGKGELPIGRRIEKSVILEINPDVAFETEVVLRVYGRQGIIVVDTLKRKEALLNGEEF